MAELVRLVRHDRRVRFLALSVLGLAALVLVLLSARAEAERTVPGTIVRF